MNIGFFTDTYLPQINGVVTSIEIFRKALIKQGHQVFIYGPRLNRADNRQHDKANRIYRFYSIPYLPQKEHRIVFPFSPHLWNFKKYQLDIIHTQTYFPMGIHAAYLARRYNIPLVHTYHTLWSEYTHYSFLPHKSTLKAITWGSKAYCNLCDLVISPSQAIKDVLLGYGVTKPIRVLPTGIEARPTDTENVMDIRKIFRIKPETRILCFAGRFGREKNLYFLLRAFKLIQQAVPDCILLMVGDGPEMNSLRNYSVQQGISQKTIFTGYIPNEQMMNVLSSAALFLFASLTETQGLAIIEAMPAGVPAVVVDAMGSRETVAGDTGGMLAQADENDFAAKSILLLTDNNLYAEKVEQTKQVREKFSATHITNQLIEHYTELVAIAKHNRKKISG